jgi:flagellar hook-length control protein FliK
MNMEQARISTSQGTQPAQAARARTHTQQKGTTDDAAGAGAGAVPASFLALLAAQDPELVETDPLAATAAGAADTAGAALQAPADPSALMGWQALVAPDAAAQRPVPGLAGQNAAMSSTTVGLGQSGSGRTAAAMWSDPAGLQGGAARLLAGQGLPAAGGLVEQTMSLDGGLADAQAPATATMGFGRQFSRQHGAALQRGNEAAAPGAGLGGASARAAATDTRQAAASVGDLSALPATLAAAVRELGAAPGQHRATGDMAAAGGEAALLAGQELAAGVVPSSRSSDAAGSDSQRHGAAGGLAEGAADTYTPGVDGAAGTGFEELAQAGIEEQLAEQVTYWANQNTQNAELTLDRDGQSLAVSVALSGNEAHVTFRSDQEHTREMLDQSMAQLSDLLRGEGLVLSGMTVGTSAGQGSAAGDTGQQGRDRSGAAQQQQGTVRVSGPTDVSQRLASTATRSNGVDVFV